ncbi:hypothetical protein Pint_04152 [Pistacia integerrima]|uniref:Uncharacterized protein n=1 Tax=Pistacia integerrima TaxID=434235 RepID=A0ACC0Z699_9ROSI|nr:hypothetical protein Pint_04152 [Pistacia integerrima]
MSSFSFCDSSLPYAVRVKDLVSRMTLTEKVKQLGPMATGVPRLGLLPYNLGSEGLHGLSNFSPTTVFDSVVPSATMFPAVILTTASFNESLWKKIGEAISTEARAMYNLGRIGLTFWSPNVNIVRDPRWGRIMETSGEDPFVIGTYAVNYVRGLQDVKGHKKYTDLNSRPLKVSSCCKHYVAYDLENWKGGDRLNFDSRVREQDMVETFQRPFEMCVKEGDASSIMCSYNSVNGTPSCADPKLLNQTVRGKWDLHGCRCGMWYVLHQLHNKCSATGEGRADMCSPENIELAKEAAKEGIVLLKNDNHTLPLNSVKFKTLALVGPHANATDAMLGNYAGYPCQYTSPIAGFSAYANVTYQKGCRHISCKNGYQTELINQVAQVSKGPVILVIMSAGGVDISFAKNNTNIKAILWAGYPGQDGGQAIADVVFGKYNPGGRLPITWYEADYVNKLPVTFMPLRPIPNLGYPGRTYKFFDGSTVYPFGYGLSYTQFKYNITSSNCSLSIKLDKFQPCRNMNYINGTQKPQCPATLVDDLKCEEFIHFQMAVQNVGNVDGSEVILVYSKPPNGIAGTHIKQVIGFQRVFVEAGQTKMVNFAVNAL